MSRAARMRDNLRMVGDDTAEALHRLMRRHTRANAHNRHLPRPDDHPTLGRNPPDSPAEMNDASLRRSNAVAGRRRAAATAVPVLIPPAMMVLFAQCNRRWGDRRGYRRAMLSYWAMCAVIPMVLAGPRPIAAVLRSPSRPLPKPRWLATVALVLPPAGAIATELAPQLRRTSARTGLTAVVVGVTNALAEELLWRALPVAVFPDDPVRGWLMPAAGFTAWHFAPLSVRPHPRGRYPILAGAAMIGAGAGWIAWSTGSLRTVLAPHAITDSCGVRAAAAIWNRPQEADGRLR